MRRRQSFATASRTLKAVRLQRKVSIEAQTGRGVDHASGQHGEPEIRPRSARRALARRPADEEAGADSMTEFGP